ncbi:YkvA family protein [Gracilibacillus xinjiangensis]|uniref:YkvA family protein n=1 Tax=Gracilibacillus xinjiangensis TaxID=1193282 RepID=A0ABV8WTZ0_9BACI
MRLWRRVKFIFTFRKSIPFFKDFFLSKEVALTKKLASILLIAAYAIFPFDLIPDFLLFFGIFDDIMLAAIILQQIVKMAPSSIRHKYEIDLK